ncbi:hypothetical protein [Nocardia gamkensis]|uniref:hypothetical protein n=1 Tax=Nocardia gamkensis TaxID=352869 RepID=UPI0037CA4B0A
MVERRILDATGLARLLGMLALLAGVVVMHSAVFGSSGHVHAAGAHAAPALASGAPADGLGRHAAVRDTTGHDIARSSHATSDSSERVTLPHCAGGGCDGAHSALHSCVFILTGLSALAALVLLYRMAVDRPGAARPRHWRARRERPPPWTVLTLAELAILRI